MLTITKRIDERRPIDAQLAMPFELRSKSRLRTALSTGEEVGLVLDRGTVLRGGDLLEASDGRIVEVIAAPERVSTVRAENPWALARVAYHLGNRHIALQVGDGWLRYLHDHVLNDMVRGLGLEVMSEQASFEPEAGAYGAGHAHGHSHPFVRAMR
jgi:urease accessory protein